MKDGETYQISTMGLSAMYEIGASQKSLVLPTDTIERFRIGAVEHGNQDDCLRYVYIQGMNGM